MLKADFIFAPLGFPLSQSHNGGSNKGKVGGCVRIYNAFRRQAIHSHTFNNDDMTRTNLVIAKAEQRHDRPLVIFFAGLLVMGWP